MPGPNRRHATASGSVISPIEEIVEEMQNGRMVILVDAEDRENEGDLVIPAQMATPDAVNFMAKHGRGLICLALTAARAHELRLEFMVRTNGSRNRTAFTQSIEAREGISTGISAFDRSRTISAAIDPTKGAGDLVSPGHVFPLIAREGGVLVRAGHTEASIDLARLAGLYPAAVICEVMNDDGTMARLDDLVGFAKAHQLKIGAIEDLIAYRLQNDRVVKRVAKTTVETATAGSFDLYVYETTTEPAEHLALVKGNLTKGGPVLVRVHAVNVLQDVLGIGEHGGSGTAVEQAMRAIAAEGRGVIVLIRDTRPKSISEWVARGTASGGEKAMSKERRQAEIGIGSQILADIGVKDMVLLTTSPEHVYVGLEAFGLHVAETRKIE
jgi:3,4-dihydroxy 2-butanone 4-phosphate synthase/GTP cyclohydrolase II